MLDYIAYIVVRGLNIIMGVIPVSFSLWIGRRFGTIAFIFNKKRRVVAYANLKAAFCNEKSPAELRALTKRVYQNMVQTFMEVLNLTKINRKYVDKYVEVVNMDRIRNASKSGRGTILLTAHFGNWELSSLVSSVEGFPIMVLVREQKMKRLNELLNALRESNGCKVIRKGMNTKNLLRALYGNNIVGILSDQDAGRNGMFIDFFGRPTSCHSGPMEIAKHTDSLILPNFIVRTKGPYHKLFLEEYIDFRNTHTEDDIRHNLQKFAALLESYIRKYPDQWLWLHKRWKSTPTRTVLVLSDGKAGHLNQSLAVAEEIRKARVTQGYKMDDTRIVIVDVKFKNKFMRQVLSACAAFATWRCHGCMRCMKLCLENDCYETLMKTYSEFVVSCGSSLAGVNIFMSKENNAKNIVVMKPGMFMGWRKFRLAVVPKHDRPPSRPNVVSTTMAPNMVDEAALCANGEKLKLRIGEVKNGAVSLFIGGDNPEFRLTKEVAGSVAGKIRDFCGRNGAAILTTTSRRTSPEVEGALKEALKNDPNNRLLVIANETNIEGAVSGMLNLSKIAVVSEESISMVSEAVASGKKVVVFKLEKNTDALTKHESALSILEQEGYITIASPDELGLALDKAWNDTRPAKPLRDREKIFAAVRKLI
ncbi:MAG: ELM1/GtrOC1 family putative glycosyltransferase [Candidatus Omnitrophota bacterium]|nr:ELM1/GtrOC1 family putative glycosyltransferase [Candidatus Omnitrophota bacterium]